MIIMNILLDKQLKSMMVNLDNIVRQDTNIQEFNDYSIVNKDELKQIHLNLTDDNFRIMNNLGLDLTNLKDLHPNRISNLAYLMTTENYKTQNHQILIQFANVLLQNSEITEASKKAIKKQNYKPVDTLGTDIY